VGEGEYEEAIKDFTSAIKIRPDYATAYFNRGNAWRGLREYDDAIRDFKKAMELDPSKKERALEEIRFCESKMRILNRRGKEPIRRCLVMPDYFSFFSPLMTTNKILPLSFQEDQARLTGFEPDSRLLQKVKTSLFSMCVWRQSR
jgi:tetratricopeptide (TPR) repeat protein